MKIHELLVTEVAQTILTIFSDKTAYADKIIEKTLKNQRKWGSRDRRFFAESVYEIVRWYRYLWFLHGYEENEPSSEELNLDLFKSLWAVWWYWQKNDVQSHFLKVTTEQIDARLKITNVPQAIRESIPDWLNQLGEKELGAEWPQLLTSLNAPASVFLRTNRLKTTSEKLLEVLQSEGVEVDYLGNDILRLRERKNVFLMSSFKDGFFEVQDWSSQQVVPFLDVKSGQIVVDACAGAGGKSLHLATLMKNKGKIISLDLYEKKLIELNNRARRDGISIIETKMIDGEKTIQQLLNTADRLLLDVPCSGLGVVRRNPNSKWKLSLEEIHRLLDIQAEILQNYSKIVKVGGKMVYATCSILPSENELQIEKFLQTNVGTSFRLIEQKRFQPNQCLGDGFYMASFERIC